MNILPRPRTFYQCTAFFVFVQFIASCNGLWFHRGRFIVNKWTRLFSAIGSTNAICCVCYASYRLFTDPTESEQIKNMDTLLLSITCLEMFASMCSYAIIVCSMQRHALHHSRLYDRIHALDQRLMREYGATLNYHKLLRKNIIEVFILATIYLFAVCNIVVQVASNMKGMVLLAASFYVGINSGMHFSCYLHTNFSDVVRIRFRLIQKILNPQYMRKKFPEAKLREVRLIGAIDIVQQLHSFIEDINAVYSTCLMVAMTHDLTLATSLFYMLFGHSISGYTSSQLFVYGAAGLLQPIYKMATGPTWCDMAVKEGKRCLRLIKLADFGYPKNSKVRTKVDAIMFWQVQNKINFTCGLNVGYNRAIISTTIAVVFNYLLILIQFRMTQLMGEQIEEQKNILQDWIGDI